MGTFSVFIRSAFIFSDDSPTWFSAKRLFSKISQIDEFPAFFVFDLFSSVEIVDFLGTKMILFWSVRPENKGLVFRSNFCCSISDFLRDSCNPVLIFWISSFVKDFTEEFGVLIVGVENWGDFIELVILVIVTISVFWNKVSVLVLLPDSVLIILDEKSTCIPLFEIFNFLDFSSKNFWISSAE